jgi:hypothetical protein
MRARRSTGSQHRSATAIGVDASGYDGKRQPETWRVHGWQLNGKHACWHNACAARSSRKAGGDHATETTQSYCSFFSATLALGANALFAQSLPGPNVPKPRPELPQQTPPEMPRQSVPGLPERKPLPRQRGTIPERMQSPEAGSQQEMVISSDDIRRTQEALKARGLDPVRSAAECMLRRRKPCVSFKRRMICRPLASLTENRRQARNEVEGRQRFHSSAATREYKTGSSY